MATTAQPPGNPPASFKFHDIYASTTHTYTSVNKESSSDKSEALNKSAQPKSLDTYADFVLVFKYKAPTKKDSESSKLEYEQKAIKTYQKVITKLARVGLQHETRPSGDDTLLVFILCPWAVLKREATRDR